MGRRRSSNQAAKAKGHRLATRGPIRKSLDPSRGVAPADLCERSCASVPEVSKGSSVGAPEVGGWGCDRGRGVWECVGIRRVGVSLLAV